MILLSVTLGSPARTRTTDMVVNSHPLYRLSYWGIELHIYHGLGFVSTKNSGAKLLPWSGPAMPGTCDGLPCRGCVPHFWPVYAKQKSYFMQIEQKLNI